MDRALSPVLLPCLGLAWTSVCAPQRCAAARGGTWLGSVAGPSPRQPGAGFPAAPSRNPSVGQGSEPQTATTEVTMQASRGPGWVQQRAVGLKLGLQRGEPWRGLAWAGKAWRPRGCKQEACGGGQCVCGHSDWGRQAGLRPRPPSSSRQGPEEVGDIWGAPAPHPGCLGWGLQGKCVWLRYGSRGWAVSVSPGAGSWQ